MKKELEELVERSQGKHTPGIAKRNTKKTTKLENARPRWHT